MNKELDDFYQEVDDLLKFHKNLKLKGEIDFESKFVKFHNYLLDNSHKLKTLPKKILENFDLQIQFYLLEYNTQSQVDRRKLQFELIRIKEINLIIRELIGIAKPNPYEGVFKGDDDKSFRLFEKFIKKHYLNPFTDFSFIFQYMKNDGYILDLKHKFFMEWLYENSFIQEKDFRKFMDRLNFTALSKLNDSSRLNSYLEIKEAIFK